MTVGLGFAVLIAIAFVALRPESGQAADGSDRQAPTTTTEAPAETTTTQPPPLTAELIDLDGAIREVVRAPIGYVGVLEQVAPRGAPPVLRSTNGVEWATVDAEVIETDEFDLLRSRFAAFIGLRAIDDGFTVLRVRQLLAEPGRTDTGLFVVDRIASEAGASWRVDPTFDEVLVGQAMPFVTASGTFLLNTLGPLPDTPQITVGGGEEILNALSSLDCSPRGSSIDLLLLDGCGDSAATGASGEVGEIDAATCRANYLDDVSAVTDRSEFVVIDDTGVSDAFRAAGLASAPQEIDGSGLFAALLHPIPEPPVECQSENFGFPVGRPAAIQVWTEPGEGGYVPLDLDVVNLEPRQVLGGVSVGSVNGDLLVATSESLVRVALDGTVSTVGSLDGIDLFDGVPAARTVDGGTEVIDIRDGVLRRFAIVDGQSSVGQEPVFEQAGFLDVRFVDDDVIVAFSSDGDRAIRLPG